jgi:hypothetical protein
MTQILFDCDRCKEQVLGLDMPSATAGYYLVSPGRAWEKYGRGDEHMVCDHCIQSMPEFQQQNNLPSPAGRP